MDGQKGAGIKVSIEISEGVASSAADTAQEAVKVWGERERASIEIGRAFVAGLLKLGEGLLQVERARAASRSAAEVVRAAHGRPGLGE